MNFKFKDHYNGKVQKTASETIKGKSMTIPDQNMSIREIIRRYASGMPLGGQREEIWQGEDENDYMPDPRTMDISEIHQMAAEARETIKEHSKRQKSKPKEQPKGEGIIQEAEIVPPAG